MDSLKGRKALVTGGSQGIGKSIAEMIAKEGCKVFVNCAHNKAKAEAVAEEIRNSGGEAEALVFDVTDENTVNRIFREKQFDILINNARLDPWLRKQEMTEGEWWDLVMNVNLKGCYLCSRAFFENAKERGWGRIVNISSVRAFIPAELNMIAYGASKLGMHGVTRAFADNGAKYGITANTVCPGMVVTENLKKRLSDEKYAQESGRIPLGRGSTPEENADAVLFVLKNGYVTGETININGGMYYAS